MPGAHLAKQPLWAGRVPIPRSRTGGSWVSGCVWVQPLTRAQCCDLCRACQKFFVDTNTDRALHRRRVCEEAGSEDIWPDLPMMVARARARGKELHESPARERHYGLYLPSLPFVCLSVDYHLLLKLHNILRCITRRKGTMRGLCRSVRQLLASCGAGIRLGGPPELSSAGGWACLPPAFSHTESSLHALPLAALAALPACVRASHSRAAQRSGQNFVSLNSIADNPGATHSVRAPSSCPWYLSISQACQHQLTCCHGAADQACGAWHWLWAGQDVRSRS